MKNCIVALDAGSSSITIAIGQRAEEEGKIVLTDITARPMQGITRGEITNRQDVSTSVREAVQDVEQRLGLRISDVYTSVSGRHIRCTNHDYYVFVGERSDGEIRREDVAALHEGMHNVQAEEGQRIMDRIPQFYVVDGRDTVKDPVGRFGKKLETTFNFVLGSSTLVDRLEKTLLALGVRSRKSFAGAIASAEAVVLPEEKEMGVAVVDLGAGTTDVCVWHDGAVRFVRSIPFGAADINNDIRQQGILEKYVEGLKIKYGKAMAAQIDSEDDKLIVIKGLPSNKQGISRKNLAIIIENRLRELIGFIMDEIGDSGYAERLGGGIVLTGGASQLTGVDELFRSETGMEVRLALPDVCVAGESLALAQNPAHATVIGLLVKALADDPAVKGGVVENPVQRPVREPAQQGHTPVQHTTKEETTPPPPETAGNDTPDEEEGEENKKGKKKRGFFNRIMGRVENLLSDETLDGDEDF